MSQDKSQPNPDWITPPENEAKTHYWGDSKFHEMVKQWERKAKVKKSKRIRK